MLCSVVLMISRWWVSAQPDRISPPIPATSRRIKPLSERHPILTQVKTDEKRLYMAEINASDPSHRQAENVEFRASGGRIGPIPLHNDPSTGSSPAASSRLTELHRAPRPNAYRLPSRRTRGHVLDGFSASCWRLDHFEDGRSRSSSMPNGVCAGCDR